MLDVRWIRDHPEELDRALARRGGGPASARVLAFDAAHRSTSARLQELQAERNRASKEIGAARGRGEDGPELMQRVIAVKDEMQGLSGELRRVSSELESYLLTLPNVLDDRVPDGMDESSHRELRRVGEPPSFAFPAMDHAALGERLGMMDFPAAARMSGARFVVLRGALARLERALAAFMIDLQTAERGYTEAHVPLMVHDKALVGTGQLPKFADDQFRVGADSWLIPTAEVPLANLVREQILEEADLPIRVAAYTPCFRSEAGAAGKDTHGMIRQHQFTKVELVSVVLPDRSAEELERMTECAEEVLKRLQLTYRVVELCAGDVGFASQRTYDLEVWLPGQNRYREISSCSNCGDFQARRMSTRFRPGNGGKGTRFVHTLNGSGLAVGRTLIAVLENFQNEDGSIAVPTALRPYFGGLEVIRAP